MEASYAEACAGNSSAKATSDCTDSEERKTGSPSVEEEEKDPDDGQEGERRKGGSRQAKEAGGTEDGT